MNHDNLAQIPVNSVLIGLFTEALNTIATPGYKYPEYITINGSPAANTSSRTYKFKSADVRTYLEGLNQMIETALTNFIPNANELTTEDTTIEADKSRVLPSITESRNENNENHQEISEEETADAENINDAVAELDNTDEQNISQSQENPTKIMSGGRRALTNRSRKLSLKKKK